MYKIILLLSLLVAISCGDSVQPMKCGAVPVQIFDCLGKPKLVKSGVSSTCGSTLSECGRMKCIFKNSGWLNTDESVDKPKVIQHFTEYAQENAQWSKAVDHIKTACLSSDLPMQGVYLDCAPYDIVHCVMTAFFRHALPSTWRSGPSCEAARWFAGACPVCPEDCYAVAIPLGSCNACRLLPSTP